MASEADKYEVLERIGQGSFGIIRKVRRKNDGLILCRKEICYTKMSQKEREQLQAELDILKRLNHPNIVRYYEREHHKASHDLHLYMEYCGNGDLGLMIKDLKARHAFADEELVWTIFAQLVSALYLCHYGEDAPHTNATAVGLAKNALPLKSKQTSHTILHRDLKPENVFLGEGNAVKLGDFGLSKIILSHDFASTYVGTPFYMSPEICAAERYSLYSDIWSLGCIMYELCTKEPPFNAKTHFDLIQKIKLGKVAPLPKPYSRELQDVISACLQVNPNARPDTAALLNLPRVKLVRKSQQNALMIQQHITVKNQALEELRSAREQIARMESDRQTERQVLHDQIDQKLRLEWEARATLEINRRVELAEIKLHAMFDQRLEEEVERRILSMPISQNTSWSSDAHSAITASSTRTEDPPVRSSTPTSGLDDNVPIAPLGPVHEAEEDDFASATDLTSLSLEDSPLVQKQKPARRSHRTPFTRAKTFANAQDHSDSPMDIQMADPTPLRSLEKKLSLSPRHAAPMERGNLRQPALRGNIFDVAGLREAGATLFPTQPELDADRSDGSDDEAASPTRPRSGLASGDPFKVPRPSGIARPGMVRQKTMPVSLHERTKSASKSSGFERPTSPRRGPVREARPTNISPARKAPPVPANPSPTALNAKKGSEDMLKAMQRNKLQGRTLVELNMAEMNQPRSSGGLESGGLSGKLIPPKVFEPLWDPERDEMPSPFLIKTRRTVASR